MMVMATPITRADRIAGAPRLVSGPLGMEGPYPTATRSGRRWEHRGGQFPRSQRRRPLRSSSAPDRSPPASQVSLRPGLFSCEATGGVARRQCALHRPVPEPELGGYRVVMGAEDVLGLFSRGRHATRRLPHDRCRRLCCVPKLLGPDPHVVKVTIAWVSPCLPYHLAERTPAFPDGFGKHDLRRPARKWWSTGLVASALLERGLTSCPVEPVEQGQVSVPCQCDGQVATMCTSLLGQH